ncbi:hypothetical protein WKI72_17040 [Candidatus Erwinia dacicola]|uniref:Uncharacterized protein n=1 Tax=Candidatus Erwinia dacicola TaxID=252393 RepID=A0A1E7Z2Z6_9GAMM|nr:hypothetical protein [Candidatus Erwinia dacicola]OFC63104.1 hypothetical protein BBW68_06740 [Candidatus Erwinia dacicola]
MSLPLREYYTIERASELLGCTFDDLVHWAMIGCIRLNIKLDQAVGILLGVDIDDSLCGIDFDVIFKGPEFQARLDDIEKRYVEYSSEDNADSSDDGYQIYFDEKVAVIHKGLKYIYANGGDNLILSDLHLSRFFSYLNYMNDRIVSEDFCHIMQSDYFGSSDFDNDFFAKNNLVKIDNATYVRGSGFFALDVEFFNNFKLDPKFFSCNGEDYYNIVTMPESNLSLSLLTKEDIEFSLNDLFIFKNDFLAIRKSMQDGVEMHKKYARYLSSNMHLWMKNVNYSGGGFNQSKNLTVKERISSPLRNVLRLLIVKHYPEYINKPSKLAEILSAEARQTQEFHNHKFDGETVARWLGLRNGSR